MKYILIAIAIIIAIPSLTLGQAASQSLSCEQTAKELESKITKITQDLDRAAFEQLVSDDAVIIRADGETRSKKQQASSFNVPSHFVFTFSSKDIKIRVCEETRIVTTGKDIVEVTEKGNKDIDSDAYWFTRIYEKRGGRWQLVFNQLTSTNE